MNQLLERYANKIGWLTQMDKGFIRPYVYVRGENHIQYPGTRHKLDWFPWEPIFVDPMNIDELGFAEKIYHLENTAFGPSAMPIPRWVFYDCAVMPGFVAGFAMRTEKLPLSIQKVMVFPSGKEVFYPWTPLSLFVIIPTMKKGEWVANNLCAVNSLLPEEERLYALGFLSKAFGLWYANVEACCGMTQWGNSALKLHSRYGHLEILTAYTPVHSHAQTITYRSEVRVSSWEGFFSREEDLEFLEAYEPSGMMIDPTQERSMIDLHRKIQYGEGPYFLGAHDVAIKKVGDPLIVYRRKGLRE